MKATTLLMTASETIFMMIVKLKSFRGLACLLTLLFLCCLARSFLISLFMLLVEVDQSLYNIIICFFMAEIDRKKEHSRISVVISTTTERTTKI